MLGTCGGFGIRFGFGGELLGLCGCGFGFRYSYGCCCGLHWIVYPGWCRGIVHTSSLDLGGNLASVGSCGLMGLRRVGSEVSLSSCLLRPDLRGRQFSCGFAVLRAAAHILCVFPL